MRTTQSKENERINANIRRAILAQGYTLKQVADELRVSQSAMSCYFKTSFPLSRALHIADFVGLRIDELTGNAEPEPKTKEITIAKCPHCGKPVYVNVDVSFKITAIDKH